MSNDNVSAGGDMPKRRFVKQPPPPPPPKRRFESYNITSEDKPKRNLKQKAPPPPTTVIKSFTSTQKPQQPDATYNRRFKNYNPIEQKPTNRNLKRKAPPPPTTVIKSFTINPKPPEPPPPPPPPPPHPYAYQPPPEYNRRFKNYQPPKRRINRINRDAPKKPLLPLAGVIAALGIGVFIFVYMSGGGSGSLAGKWVYQSPGAVNDSYFEINKDGTMLGGSSPEWAANAGMTKAQVVVAMRYEIVDDSHLKVFSNPFNDNFWFDIEYELKGGKLYWKGEYDDDFKIYEPYKGRGW